MTGSSDWISIVEMDPSTHGDKGGPWKLTVVRTTFSLSEDDRSGDRRGDGWWGLIRFERLGYLSIWRAEDGRVERAAARRRRVVRVRVRVRVRVCRRGR